MLFSFLFWQLPIILIIIDSYANASLFSSHNLLHAMATITVLKLHGDIDKLKMILTVFISLITECKKRENDTEEVFIFW